MNDLLVKYYQNKEEDDSGIFHDLETLFRTSRTPEKSLKKRITEDFENYIMTIQSDLLVQQLYRQASSEEEPDEKQLAFYRQKLSDTGKQRIYIERKMKYMAEAMALWRVQQDTNGLFLEMEEKE